MHFDAIFVRYRFVSCLIVHTHFLIIDLTPSNTTVLLYSKHTLGQHALCTWSVDISLCNKVLVLNQIGIEVMVVNGAEFLEVVGVSLDDHVFHHSTELIERVNKGHTIRDFRLSLLSYSLPSIIFRLLISIGRWEWSIHIYNIEEDRTV